MGDSPISGFGKRLRLVCSRMCSTSRCGTISCSPPRRRLITSLPLALRNDRFELDELHLMDADLSYPRLAVTGDVFYQLSGNDVINRRLGGEQLIVPQRDVLHIRLHTSRNRFPNPLIGESPIVAAYSDVGM